MAPMLMYRITIFQVRLDTMITVVDAGAFLEAYTTGDRMVQRPDLGVNGRARESKVVQVHQFCVVFVLFGFASKERFGSDTYLIETCLGRSHKYSLTM